MGVPIVGIYIDTDFAANNRMGYVRPQREQGPVTYDRCVWRALLECALSGVTLHRKGLQGRHGSKYKA